MLKLIFLVAHLGSFSPSSSYDDVMLLADISKKLEGDGGGVLWFAIAAEFSKYEDHEMAVKAKELLIMLPIILHGVVRVQVAPSLLFLETFLYGCFDHILLMNCSLSLSINTSGGREEVQYW